MTSTIRTFLVRVMVTGIGLGLSLAAMTLIMAWGVGELFGDRQQWSQWLSWIPSLILLPGGLCWAAGFGLLMPGKRIWRIGPVLMVTGPLLFLGGNWRAGSGERVREGLTITQWTLGTIRVEEDELARDLLAQGSQLNVVEGGGRLRWNAHVREWLGPDQRSASTGIFSVISQLPIQKLRSAVWAEGIHVAELVVHGPGFEEVPLSILLVDLPSTPRRSRAAIAHRLRELLPQASLGTYDLVIGDFNMPADSDALASLFPGFEPVWPSAGSGWAGTYPRSWPLVRIDHVLAGPRVDVTFIETVDPGRGRHRLQNLDVRPRRTAPPPAKPLAHSDVKMFQTSWAWVPLSMASLPS